MEKGGRPQAMSARKMDARALVDAERKESEATCDQPLPEAARGKRRGRSVVQSVRLPAEEFAEIERIEVGKRGIVARSRLYYLSEKVGKAARIKEKKARGT